MNALYSESLIADKLGVSRDELTTVRQALLKKGADWKKKGREVVLTESGLKITRRYFAEAGLTTPKDFDDCVLAGKKEVEDGPLELTVLRRFPNVGLLLATTAGGEEVRVRVPDNRNFRPAMKIHAKPPKETGPQVYRLEGRCPRFPGRF